MRGGPGNRTYDLFRTVRNCPKLTSRFGFFGTRFFGNLRQLR